METNVNSFSNIPIWDMLAKGELPEMYFGITDDTYFKLSATLIISFVVIIAFWSIAYKKVLKS